jgi:hypothetical protein
VDLIVEKLDKKVTTKGNSNLVEIFNFITFNIMGIHSSTLLELHYLLEIGDLTFSEPLYLLQNLKYTPWVAMIFTSLKVINML